MHTKLFIHLVSPIVSTYLIYSIYGPVCYWILDSGPVRDDDLWYQQVPTCKSVYPSVCLSVCLYVCVCLDLSESVFVSLFENLAISPTVCKSILCKSIHLSICWSGFFPVVISFYPFVCMPFCLRQTDRQTVCRSVCVSISFALAAKPKRNS